MNCKNQNRPSLFPGRSLYAATKPGFSFLSSCYVVVYFVTDACLLLLCLFYFSVLSQEIGWEERLRNDLFLCRVGCETLTQSILQQLFWKRTFGDKWRRFIMTRCSSCHPTDSVKSTEAKSTHHLIQSTGRHSTPHVWGTDPVAPDANTSTFHYSRLQI